MKYSGIDLHSNNSVVSVIDDTDRVVAEKRLPNHLTKILALLVPWQAELADEVFGDTGWLSSEFYKQFLKPSDVRYILGADLRTQSGVECRCASAAVTRKSSLPRRTRRFARCCCRT